MNKVLIADDEYNIRNILDFSLNSEGFDVITADSGEDAFSLAVSELPDLVILDVMMPGQGGIETCRQIKADERTSGIPVILLTARGSREDRKAGTKAGADEYITKPFSPQKVVNAVQNFLGIGSK